MPVTLPPDPLVKMPVTLSPDLPEEIPPALSPDLLLPRFHRPDAHTHAGHCYSASEAYFHAIGGRAAGLKPVSLRHEGVVHWWIRDAGGTDIDLTAAQFATPVPYALGRPRGFLTRAPSARARELLRRIGFDLALHATSCNVV